ncbi:thrombopoietin receptor isoform X4 [Paroedura picta]|uniref:thrombopoietin receptor isoform X4 n=1 Tax=Paroedura picta TaxID=143630 RepID=UPI004056982C
MTGNRRAQSAGTKRLPIGPSDCQSGGKGPIASHAQRNSRLVPCCRTDDGGALRLPIHPPRFASPEPCRCHSCPRRRTGRSLQPSACRCPTTHRPAATCRPMLPDASTSPPRLQTPSCHAALKLPPPNRPPPATSPNPSTRHLNLTRPPRQTCADCRRPAPTGRPPYTPSGEIGLLCFTPDLHQLHCQWDWEPTEPGPSHSILYWAENNSSSTRTQTWHKCEEEEEDRVKSHYHTSFHICTFQPSNGSYISVLVIVTQGQSQKEVNYFKEPFDLHRVVLTAPPRILQPNVRKGILKLEWVTPLEALAEHMVYQIQYAVQDSLKWKVLHVQYSTNCEILDLDTGSHYCLQLRTRPDGQKYQGSWSAWSNAECIEIPPGSGSTGLSVAITLLFCAGLVLGLGCTCLSTYSSVKQKLWPPIPDLQHVLDGFFEDNSKQDQQVNAFFCDKTLENPPLTCPLEVLSEISLDVRSYGPFPDAIEQMEWGNQLSSYQHYMVLSPRGTQKSIQENEYFDGTLDGSDTFPMPLEHGSHTASDSKVHLSSFTLCSVLPSPSERESAEVSGEQSTSPTHISNQSYLLMG